MKTIGTATACTGILLGLVAAPASAAPAPSPINPVTKKDINRAVEALPKIVKRTMRKTGVPGIAVAVVHKDRVIYKRGFGLRSTKTGKKVTPSTVFQIASVSKPVGASVVASAISDKIAKWTSPVNELNPGLELSDPWVTSHVTVGDLYAHRSGLPANSGNDLEAFGFDRDTIIERLRYEPLSPFRITYSYSNFGMTSAGDAVARAAGTSWESLADRLLFKPLKMKRSSYSHADFVREKNTAALHQPVKGKWVPFSKRNADAQAPAGGLSSSVEDMSRWLRMELANGKFGGKRVTRKGPLNQSRSLQIPNSPTAAAAQPPKGYGFGMGVETDSTSRVRWAHSGAFTSGAATRIMMIPDLDLGIVILTNAWPVGAPEAIGEYFADQVEYGRPTQNWFKVTKAGFAPLTAKPDTIFGQKKPKNPVASQPLPTYVGTYANDYVGTASITEENGKLVMRVGPNGVTRLPLRHFSGDTFYYQAIEMPPGYFTGVRFTGDGTASSLEIEEVNSGLGVLTRS